MDTIYGIIGFFIIIFIMAFLYNLSWGKSTKKQQWERLLRTAFVIIILLALLSLITSECDEIDQKKRIYEMEHRYD